MFDLIAELTTAHSPVGNEREIDAVLRRHLDPLPCDVWQDSAGNLIVKVAGAASDCPLILDAHKDELGLVIKRIEDDGKIRVANLGGTYPWKYGEGPMDILADEGTVPAVLCFGAMHVTEESPIHAIRSEGGRSLKWSDCYLDAKLGKEELLACGVHPGSKAVVARERKHPLRIGDYVGTYALDDKGAGGDLGLTGRAARQQPAAAGRILGVFKHGRERRRRRSVCGAHPPRRYVHSLGGRSGSERI